MEHAMIVRNKNIVGFEAKANSRSLIYPFLKYRADFILTIGKWRMCAHKISIV